MSYTVWINYGKGQGFMLDSATALFFTDFNAAMREGLEPGRVAKFATGAEAAKAGNAYCDAVASHPVYGTPGFEVREI